MVFSTDEGDLHLSNEGKKTSKSVMTHQMVFSKDEGDLHLSNEGEKTSKSVTTHQVVFSKDEVSTFLIGGENR